MESERGKFILFEGGEGSGKTSQIIPFSAWLTENKVPNIRTREPGGTPIAEKVRDLLLDPANEEMEPLTELLLYSAARAQHYLRKVVPSLEEGKTVLCDRNWPSTEAYQGAAGDIDKQIISDSIKMATVGVIPDLLYVIDIDPAVGLGVEEDPDRMSAMGLEYHKKVRQGYLEIVKNNPDFAVKIDYRSGDPDGMQEEMRQIARDRLGLEF